MVPILQWWKDQLAFTDFTVTKQCFERKKKRLFNFCLSTGYYLDCPLKSKIKSHF